MNEIILNSGFPLKRTRLTREELMAGQCAPGNLSEVASDPRLRSPDEILFQKAPRLNPSPTNPDATTLQSLQKRYEVEIAAWREYEQQVLAWKKNISVIVEQYKEAAHEKDVLLEELNLVRQKMTRQEQELAWLRHQLHVPNSSVTL